MDGGRHSDAVSGIDDRDAALARGARNDQAPRCRIAVSGCQC